MFTLFFSFDCLFKTPNKVLILILKKMGNKIVANLLLLYFIQPFVFFQLENKSNKTNETDMNSTIFTATPPLLATSTTKELSSSKIDETEMASCPISRGTTPGLEEIVIGRCNNFLSIIQKTNCEIRVKNISCLAIWNEFRQAVVNKDPCNITAECFRNFISVGRHPIKRDASIFWSGTKELTQQSSWKYVFIINLGIK